MKFVVSFVLLTVNVICQAAYYDSYDYCKLPCNYGFGNEVHVKCERKEQKCSVDKYNCHEQFEEIHLNDHLKRIILDEHNRLRNVVASGEEKRGQTGAQPPAANMMALKYNDELASVALCWANTCQVSKHSVCHRTKNMPYAGQNLAYRYYNYKEGLHNVEENIKLMINSWYDEVELFDKCHIKPYQFKTGVGHYTVMVWGNIQQIGCAVVKFKKDEWYTIYMVCNYASTELAGNIIEGEMYKIGRSCTACPKNTSCNPRYSGLCGEDELDMTEKKGKSNRSHPRNLTFP